jgi:hypothetical protein
MKGGFFYVKFLERTMDYFLMHAVLDGVKKGLIEFEQVKAENFNETFTYDYDDGEGLSDTGYSILQFEKVKRFLKREGFTDDDLTKKGLDLLLVLEFISKDKRDLDYSIFEFMAFDDAVDYVKKRMRADWNREIVQIAATDETVFALDSLGNVWHKNFDMRDFRVIESSMFGT